MTERTFTVAATLSDPLAAERLVAELTTQGIEAFSRPGGAATFAAFAAAQPAFWDLMVDADRLDAARAIAERFQAELLAEGEANEKAAEAEALAAPPPDEP